MMKIIDSIKRKLPKIEKAFYTFTSKISDIKDFIVKWCKKLKDSPYAGIIYLFMISVIAAVISICVSNISSKTEPETESIVEAAVTPFDTKVPTAIPVTTDTTTETTEEITEETTTAKLIDISELQISNQDLSEKTNRNNAVSTSDAPVTPPTTTINFSPDNYDSVIYGIDVSKWQGDIDWNQVAAAGYKFVFVKVGGRGTSSGSLYYDEKFRENIEGASRAGLNVGVYFFSQAINEREALEEASLTIDAIKGYNITYPVVFDWETGWFSNKRPYRANAANLSNAAMTSIVNTFLSTVESYGYEAMVYGNGYDLSLFDIGSVSKSHKVWYARYWSYYRNYNNYYVPGNQTPETPFQYDIWQYKDTGTVPGISEKVDLNVQFITNNIEINVPSKDITIEAGGSVDLMKNVTSKNGKGKDITSSVTYKIKNSSGNEVTLQDAINNSGKYTVVYTAQDLGVTYSIDDVILTVISKPIVLLKQTKATYFKAFDNENITDEEISVMIDTLINENLISAKSYINEDLSANVIINVPEELYSLQEGVHTVTYSVKDSSGIEGNSELKIAIVNKVNDCVLISQDIASANTFKNTLNSLLISNLSVTDISNVSIEYSDELTAAIQSKTFNVGDTFTIKYKSSDMSGNQYVLSCEIKITEPEETETTSLPEDTTSEENTSSNSETTTNDETTTNETT